MQARSTSRSSAGVLLAMLLFCGSALAAGAATWEGKVDPLLLTVPAGDECEFLVVMTEQGDLSAVHEIAGKVARGRYVFDTLLGLASRSQAPIRAALEAAGVRYRSFWIANMLWVKGDASTIEMLARRDDVGRIDANARARLAAEEPAAPTGDGESRARGIAWNIEWVNAPAVWATGNTGQAGVVGGVGTGYEWGHPAIIRQYRGWDGVTADHDYNWHDAIHSGGGPCGANSPEPCDDNAHGTHTMGVMVGDDGAGNQIGMAPGARWVGCRCMDEGWGTAASYIECLEWMAAPYPVGGFPEDGDPAMAPDCILNAWSCGASQGCALDTLLPVIQNVRAAGIVVVAIAGGLGPPCSTIEHTPAIYDESFTVGATSAADMILSFSGRGPVTVDGSGRLKPDLCAPGEEIRSSVPGGDYAVYSGTSPAASHVAGLVALVVTAKPELAGDVDGIETAITSTAVPRTSGQCGDGDAVPNNVYGHGRIDAEAACSATIGVVGPESVPIGLFLPSNAPNPFDLVTVIRYRLSESAPVSLRVYDVSGHLVRNLMIGAWILPGDHEATWDGRDSAGRLLAPGVYFCRLETPGFARTGRMLLAK